MASIWRSKRFTGTHRSSGKGCILGTIWADHCSRRTASATSFIRSSSASFPNSCHFCSTLTKSSSLVTKKDVSCTRDGFTAWAKTDPEVILRRHTINVKSVNEAFSDAHATKHSPSCQENHVNSVVPNQLTGQRRFSIKTWNPEPRRGAIEQHVAVEWHIITLQEAIEHVELDFLTDRYHVIRSCEQDKVKEGASGCVLQGLIYSIFASNRPSR